ncbi:MAG: hypothetical protein HRU70_06290 [Phycisphaeraceae bacterium]|nr:MAG: hypothetical protein HRU70_06290 [Phycisphaeraceae bacterium]
MVTAVLVTGLLLAVGLVVATRGPVPRILAQRILSREIGAPVSLSGARLNLDGTVELFDARVINPDESGPHAAFIEARRVTADARWWGLHRTEITGVTAEGVVVRVSQSVRDRRINAKIAPPPSTGPVTIPPVTIRDGHLELGEHDLPPSASVPGGYHALKRVPIAGGIAPASVPGSYGISLHELSAAGKGLTIDGGFDERELTLRILGFRLDAFPPHTLPPAVRGLAERLNLRGDVSAAGFILPLAPGSGNLLARAQNSRAFLDLAGVAVTLPVQALASGDDGAAAYPRMSGVSGRITLDAGELRAEIAGLLEDFPYQASLVWRGTTPDAAFECTFVSRDFQLQERPRMTPFLPPQVAERLAMFTNPTARVDAQVVVTREPPTADNANPETRVAGTLTFRDGTASFRKFPYVFEQMTGTATFDDRSLTIERIEGRHANGARLVATASIAPLTDEAEVTVRVTATGVPVDEDLIAGLGPRRRKVIDILFDPGVAGDLVRKGLVVTPEEHDRRSTQAARAAAAYEEAERGFALMPTEAARRSLDEAREALRAAEASASVPLFEPGGVGNVEIELYTPFGKDADWEQRIEVHIPRAGVVPERFPLPAVATDVRVVVDDTTLTITDGRFLGLRGGVATVNAVADFSSDAGEDDPGPVVAVEAVGFPIDDLLLNAIPSSDRPLREDDPGSSLARIIRDLNIEASTSARVEIADTTPGETGFKARVEFGGLTARPARESERGLDPLVLAARHASLVVTQDDLWIAVDADVLGAAGEGAGGRPSGRLIVVGEAFFSPRNPNGSPGATDIHAQLTAIDLDLSAPVERALSLIAPGPASGLRDLRGRHHPSGRATLHASVAASTDGPPDVTVGLEPGAMISLRPDGMPRTLTLGPTEGAMALRTVPGAVLTLGSLRGPLRMDGEGAGALDLSGSVSLDDSVGSSVTLDLSGGRMESALADAVFERLGPRAHGAYTEWAPSGDLDTRVVASRAEGPGAAWGVSGTLRPSSLGVTAGGSRVEFASARGEVRFDMDSGVIERLDVATEDWGATLSGSWTRLPGGHASLALDLSAKARGLPGSLTAFLPDEARTLMGDLDLAAESLEIPALSLNLGFHPDAGKPTAYRASGRAVGAGVGLDAGAEIADAEVDATFDLSRDTLGVQTARAEIGFARAKAGGVSLTGGRVVLVSSEAPGEYLIPLIEADCHGGRVAGEARVVKPVEGAGGRARFSTRIDASGVRLDRLLSDLGTDPSSGSGAPALIDAGLTIAGSLGDPSSRRGRGLAYVGGGRVLALPVVLPLIEISNLRIPTGEPLDTLRASFYIEGAVLCFERISILSPAVELRGFGTLDWSTRGLDMIFTSRSLRRIPILSPVIETVRNEIVTTQVSGTLSNPSVGVAPLRATQQLLSGSSESDQERRMRDIERQSPLNADRLRVRIPPR